MQDTMQHLGSMMSIWLTESKTNCLFRVSSASPDSLPLARHPQHPNTGKPAHHFRKLSPSFLQRTAQQKKIKEPKKFFKRWNWLEKEAVGAVVGQRRHSPLAATKMQPADATIMLVLGGRLGQL